MYIIFYALLCALWHLNVKLLAIEMNNVPPEMTRRKNKEAFFYKIKEYLYIFGHNIGHFCYNLYTNTEKK